MSTIWRPEQLTEERISRSGRNVFPTGLNGSSGVPSPVMPSYTDQQAAIRGSANNGGQTSLRHTSEILKVAGETPVTEYLLALRPASTPFWPQVFAGGAIQFPGVDYEVAGRTLTVLTPMSLLVADVLYCDYDYVVEATEDDPDA